MTTVVPIHVEGDSAYVYLFGENEAHGVAKTISVDANLDINHEGEVIGIEILGWPI